MAKPKMTAGPAKKGGNVKQGSKAGPKRTTQQRLRDKRKTVQKLRGKVKSLRGGGGGGGEAVEPAPGEEGYVEPDTGTTSMLRAQGKSYAKGKEGIGNYSEGETYGGGLSANAEGASGTGGAGGKGKRRKGKGKKLTMKAKKAGSAGGTKVTPKERGRIQRAKGVNRPGGKPKGPGGHAKGKGK